MLTALDRDGSLLDSDKSIWFQGRTAWMYATACQTYGEQSTWRAIAASCLDFIEKHGVAENGKLWFTVTQDGRPLRMRRYVYSEAFAAVGNAAMFGLTGEETYHRAASRYLANYLHYSFTPGMIAPKIEPETRSLRSIGPLMFSLHTASIVMDHLGDITVGDQRCSQWIQWSIEQIQRYFVKRDLRVLMENVSDQGEIVDHFDGRQLNPGHAIECAWFLLHEARRNDDRKLQLLGCEILDWMWERGWDEEFGGIFYFRDLYNRPVQEYWQDMKFWWPHCEALITTLLAYSLTGNSKYAQWHEQLRTWSFDHFADLEHGEWYGYLHRDGSPSVRLKGNMWKGPYHLPRMLWYCEQLLNANHFAQKE
jgi:N-acylglucosamine 2-epimerase